MKLTVLERVTLLQVLPEANNYMTMKIVGDLRNELSLDEAEMKKLKVVQDGDQFQWDDKIDNKNPKDVPIGLKATEVIVDALKELDKQKKLEQRHMSLYEKFVEK